MCVLAGLAALSVCANAFTFDAQIVIDRAINSPNLSVRYTGATVVLVELKVNGESLGTRSVSAAKDSGETNFTLNLASLHDGDNTVEVCLFDKAGKLVGTQKTVISTDNNVQGPVFLTAPKIGATVHGPVAISVGFGRDLRNSYVSFFIDNQFKSLTNAPPFDYIWDTERETNGWHEVEAWVIDDTSTTFKTRKIRVLVNNGGGRTARFTAPTSAGPKLTALNNGKSAGTGNAKGLKPVPVTNGASTDNNITSVAPVIEGTVANNAFNPTVGDPSPSKHTLIAQSIATGPRFLTPTGTRVAGPTISELKATTRGATVVAMTKGQRWPNLGSLSIMYNSSLVHFDVAPRIQDGVPMTPFRHLLEKAGGTVDWVSLTKSVKAQADGRDIFLTIGDKIATINRSPIELELAPFLERGRTIVPLSFLRDALNVNIEYDKVTGHVLITSTKKQ